MKAGVVLVMIGITVAACLAFDFNPRLAYYLPLLPSVLISAILFGFGTSLFAVIASIVAADFFFAPPVFDFGITEWEDVLGLATFGIICRATCTGHTAGRRRNFRGCNVPATIYDAARHLERLCILVDLSNRGARIAGVRAHTIPDEF
jgi:K+-sensing histidine kinase KdpD